MKLELSSEGRYALRTLVYLARDADRGALIVAGRIADEVVLPRCLLARVMAKLARRPGGEQRGEGRDSRLARAPEDRGNSVEVSR